MTALMLYGAVLLMVASVLVNRIGQRRAALAHQRLQTDEGTLRTLEHEVGDRSRALHILRERCAGLDGQLDEARVAVDQLSLTMEQAKAAPVERYFIFDRQDPRPGAIWALQVRRSPDAPPSLPRMEMSWKAPRTYLVVAATQREAMDRVTHRYARNAGFDVGTAAPCHLFKTRPAGPADAALNGRPAAGPRSGQRRPATAG